MNVLELKGKRVSKGYKQSQIAEMLNMTSKTFCIYENSKKCKFSLGQIETLSKLYGLDIDDVNYIFFENMLPNGNNICLEPERNTGELVQSGKTNTAYERGG